VFGLFPLKRRRADLDRTLRADLAQPAGWQPWLDNATSISQLHASCPQPGWLVHCAYWADVSQDKLLEGALALGRLACERDPTPPISPATIDTLRDQSWPDLATMMFDLLVASPTTRLVVELLPTQPNSLMWPLTNLLTRWHDHQEIEADVRRWGREPHDDDVADLEAAEAAWAAADVAANAADADRSDDAASAAAAAAIMTAVTAGDRLGRRATQRPRVADRDASFLGPYRADPMALPRAQAVPLIAAGHVLTIETVFHRHKGLREALCIRSAAAAALFCLTAPSFQAEALALLRATYWT
jgi:hypothetical protein